MLYKTVNVVVVVIIFHAARKREAGGILLVLRDTKGFLHSLIWFYRGWSMQEGLLPEVRRGYGFW